MLRRFALQSCLTAALLTACAASGVTPSGTSGITGLVVIGPICPVESTTNPTACAPQPYQAMITVLDSSGRRVTQFQSDAAGHFTVALAPGTYTLHPETPTGKPLPYGKEQTVTVASGLFTTVTITYDSGIR